MERKNVLETIREVLHKKLKVVSNPSLVTEETDLYRDFNIDSMQIMSFVVELEDAFDMVIVSETLDVDTITNVGLLIDYIVSQ